MEMSSSGLWVPPSNRSTSKFKKADPPVTGEIGRWATEGLQFATLPGGGILQFDLNQLTMSDFRMMRDHYQINANLTLLTFMVHQIDWRIECEDQSIADEIEEILRPIWTQIVRGFSQAFWSGYSPMVLQFENDVRNRRVVLDKVKDLVPEDCRVNWKKVKGYNPRGQGAPAPTHHIYDGIKQAGSSYAIPVENTLWYPLLMENGDYYGRKLLRPAFIPWFFSMLIHLFANRYFERFGEPLPIGRANYAQEFEIGGELVDGRTAMENILKALRSRSVVTLPSDRDPETKEYDFDLEYLESQMRGADFERYLTRLDEEMSLGLFTPILMLRTADVGSYNLGVNHMQVWMWMLNALAQDMKQYLDAYLIEKIKGYNFTPNAPRAQWVPRPLGKQESETMRAIVTQLMSNDKVTIADLDEFGQALGLTLKEVRQVQRDDDDPEPGTEVDTRVGRPEREPEGRPRVENSRATLDEISQRVQGQVSKAFRDGHFGSAEFIPNIGYRRRMEDSLVDDGYSEADARLVAAKFFARIESWVADFTPMGESVFVTPEQYRLMFEKAAQVALEEAME